MDADAQDQQKPNHHPQLSSSFSLFTEQAIQVGYPNDKLRGRFEMTEAIRREFEKERIREEIIEEEVARRRLLEAEVRHELMMEHEMAMIQQEEKLVMSVDGKYGRGGHLREIRAFSGSTFQLLGDSPKIKGIPEDNKKEVIFLGKLNDETVSGTKRKSASPVSEGSSQHGSDRSKKKAKEERSCAICHVSTTSERSLTEHLQGKKHRAKEAALVAKKTGANFGLGVATKNHIINPSSSLEKKSETVKEAVDQTSEANKTSSTFDQNDVNKKDKFKFWCEMCQVGALSETVMNTHRERMKHLAPKEKMDPQTLVMTNQKPKQTRKRSLKRLLMRSNPLRMRWKMLLMKSSPLRMTWNILVPRSTPLRVTWNMLLVTSKLLRMTWRVLM
ncbi:hypothetical protein L1987_21049 [Smallanthus sonchifolius]|uniref:Uncharacterized protein n=1 Tax=Smallanthus sonchifolius TaxID=185202 RepID=A0ACB9ISX3_9ASTR|nr:hypothetical protein L1987_21049 [Smallanthus sonchifolius]